MITKISSSGIDRFQTSPFFLGFVSIPIAIGIIINLLNAQFDIAIALLVMLCFCAVGIIVNLYFLKYLRDVSIDDEDLDSFAVGLEPPENR